MNDLVLLVSDDGFSKVKIEKGELISFQKNEVEYIHQKQDLGWNNSDTEMFPIIGPTKNNSFVVHTKNGDVILDQHGLLREFDYELVTTNNNKAVYKKEYIKNTELQNRKFPYKSSEEFVFWSYDFTFNKSYLLTNKGLEITFEFTSKKDMPFMLGYHPAFQLSGLANEILKTNTKTITLDDVYKAGADAYPVLNCEEITLVNHQKNEVKITTKGFDNFMLWTEVDNMLCIEPITQYNSSELQKYSEKNMRLSSGKEAFKVTIEIL